MATFISSVLAGIMIGIGGSVFVALSATSRVAGAILFAVGLFTVIVFRLHLYTGKICYAYTGTEKWYIRAANLALILFGNTVGASLAGFAMSEKLMPAASGIVSNKLTAPLWLVFILGAFCGILIYVAVEGYRRAPDGVKAAMVFLGVSVFILAGFEHSIADIFYFAAAREISVRGFVFLMVVVLGNTVGGMLFAWLHAIYDRLAEKEAKKS